VRARQLTAVPGVTVYGPPSSRGRAALCSFNVEGLHATDVSTLLDHSGAAPCPVCNCCCHPLMENAMPAWFTLSV